MQEPVRQRPERFPLVGEETSWPTERSRVPHAGEIEFDDTVQLPRPALNASWQTRLARWVVADITENTRIAIKAGSVFGALLVVFAIGTWYGDLRRSRSQDMADRAAQNKTDERQDLAITQLQQTVQGMNTTLQLIKQAQDKDMPQLIRQSTYTTEIMRDIEVALSARGISTKEHGP